MFQCDTEEERQKLKDRFGELLDDVGHTVGEEILDMALSIYLAGHGAGCSDASYD